MGVLQPWLLALGVGVAVPLLLHLFQRHQGPRVLFPALRYLRRAERESARRVKLRQWLLMLLRMALILALTLAAARPFLLAAGGAHEPTAVVIVLDNSLSTGAVAGERRVLDELRERALEVLALAGPDDRFWLLRAGSPREPALAGDAAASAERVRQTEPTSAEADLAGALERARAILATSAEGRAAEIHLLSDLQANQLRRLEARGTPPPLVVWSPTTEAPPNRAVINLAVAGGLPPLAGSRSQLTAVLYGSEDARDSAAVRLFAGDRLLAAATARPDASVLLPLPARPEGLLRGRVEIDADALHADDVRYFVARVRPPPAVAAPGASPFLQDALLVLEQAGRVRPAPAAAAQVVLLGDAAPLPPARSDRTVVVLPPSDPVRLPALNRQLAAAGIAWSYAPAASEGATSFAVADSTDPLFRSLQQARLARNYPLGALRQPAGDSVLLRTSQGHVWAVRGERRGGGRYLLLGSPLDPEATTIPTTAAMIPLLDRIIAVWSAPQPERLEVRAGEALPLPAAARQVRRPDGVLEPVTPGTYEVAPMAGIHEVLAGDSLLTAFAVNPPPAESELRRVRADQLEAIFNGWQVTRADSPERWRRVVYRARLGLELWRWLLLAALLLLATEALLAATGARRARTQAAAVEAA